MEKPTPRTARIAVTALVFAAVAATLASARPARAEGGLLQGLADRVTAELGPLGPAPTLPRPVLMVPGLFMPASSFGKMAGHLATNPENGGRYAVFSGKDGRFHENGARGRTLAPTEVAATRIFVVDHADPRAPSAEKAPQLAQAMEAIAAAKGAGARTRIDVVTHSAGQHNFGAYLAGKGDGDRAQVGNVVFVTPAIHGTFMGNLGKVFGGLVGVKAAATELAIGSASIAAQRAAWPGLRERHIAGEVTVIAVAGAPTVARENGRLRIATGDGFMPAAGTRLPGARNVTVRTANPTPVNHLVNNRYAGAIHAAEAALAGPR